MNNDDCNNPPANKQEIPQNSHAMINNVTGKIPKCKEQNISETLSLSFTVLVSYASLRSPLRSPLTFDAMLQDPRMLLDFFQRQTLRCVQNEQLILKLATMKQSSPQITNTFLIKS